MTSERPLTEPRPKNWPLNHFNENGICLLARRLENNLPVEDALAKALYLNAWSTVANLLDMDMIDQETIVSLLGVNMNMDEVNQLLLIQDQADISDIEQRTQALAGYLNYLAPRAIAQMADDSVNRINLLLAEKLGFKPNPRPEGNGQKFVPGILEEIGRNLAQEQFQRLLPRL